MAFFDKPNNQAASAVTNTVKQTAEGFVTKSQSTKMYSQILRAIDEL